MVVEGAVFGVIAAGDVLVEPGGVVAQQGFGHGEDVQEFKVAENYADSWAGTFTASWMSWLRAGGRNGIAADLMEGM